MDPMSDERGGDDMLFDVSDFDSGEESDITIEFHTDEESNITLHSDIAEGCSTTVNPITSFLSPPKKKKIQDFELCLICNVQTAKRKGKLHRWTIESWETFSNAACRVKDEVYSRLESYIDGTDSFPVQITELWKHPTCYSRYKNPNRVQQQEKQRLKAGEKVDESEIQSPPDEVEQRPQTRSTTSTNTSSLNCIICMKERKWLFRKKRLERTMKITLKSAGDVLVQTAKKRNHQRILRDLGNIDDGGDVIAKDVMVHNSCRSAFISERNIKYSCGNRSELTAYDKAFQKVATEVQKRIVNGMEVVLMNDLAGYMNSALASLNVERAYTTHNLKSRLVQKFGTKIDFWHPKWRGDSEYIYSNEIPLGKLVRNSVESDQKLTQAMADLEQGESMPSTSKDTDETRHAFTTGLQIHKAINEIPKLPWPPCPEDMTEDNINLPDVLYNELVFMLAGDKFTDTGIENENQDAETDYPKTRSRTPSGMQDMSIKWSVGRNLVKPELHKKVISIGQDIVHAASNGRIQTVKHVILAKAIQQKTGSLAMVTLLNKHQHCINKSMLQEIDTANAELILLRNQLGFHSPQGMSPNVPCMFGWDNNDYKNRGHFTGALQVHDTTGYMAQPMLPVTDNDTNSDRSDRVSYPRTRQRAIKVPEDKIHTCIVGKRTDPPRHQDASVLLTRIDQELVQEANDTDLAWRMTRMGENFVDNVQPSDQHVPGWKGFNCNIQRSVLHTVPNILPHKIGYCQTIHKPPDHNVIYTFLTRSVEMADEVMDDDHGKGTCSVQVVVDMGIWTKAMEVVLAKQAFDPNMKRIVLHQGPFHTAMRFMACPGYLFGKAGLRDIFIEAGLLAEGSVDRVLSGEHWERGFYAHSLAAEAFERLRFKTFTQQLDSDEPLVALKAEVDELRQNISAENLNKLTNSENFVTVTSMYKEYVSSLGPNGKFWTTYLEIIGILLRHVRASRTGDWFLNLNTELEMLPWFVACGRTVYSRYKPVYLLNMLQLQDTHNDAYDQLVNGNLFTIQKSESNPFGRVPADQETEMGVNRDSKSPGGIADISMKPAATLKWEILSTQRAEFMKMCTILTGEDTSQVKDFKADDAGKTRIKDDECKVQQVMETIENWTNPFADTGPLCHITSGRQAPEEVSVDVLTAHEKGKRELVKFVTERLQPQCNSTPTDETTENGQSQVQSSAGSEVSFYAPWPKLKLKTFDNMTKGKRSTSKDDKTRLRDTRDMFHKMIVLSMERQLEIDKVLQFPLGPFPYSLATADGELVKTSKSVLMHELENLVEPTEPSMIGQQTILLDAMVQLQCLKLSPETTFGDLAETVLKAITRIDRMSNSATIHWIVDTYPTMSIKSSERDSRMRSLDGSFATTISSAGQKVDKQFKKALRDGNFKDSLSEFFIREWQTDKYTQLIGRNTLYATAKDKCYKFTVNSLQMECEVIQQLEYRMEEADQRLIFHAEYAARQLPQPDTIVIRSPDTDVIVLASAACGLGWIKAKCMFLTGSGSKTRYVDVSAIGESLGKDVCEALIGAHPFTGCDSTSAFKGRGKSGVIWLLQNDSKFCNAMAMLGKKMEPPVELFERCEEATCIFYSYNARGKKLNPVPTLRVNEYRTLLFLSGTSDPERLPPCQDVLRKKIRRANYQAYLSRHCLDQTETPPPPIGQGWTVQGDHLTIDWMDVSPAPSEVLAMTSCKCKTDCKSRRCKCLRSKLKCTSLCKCNSNCNNRTIPIQAHSEELPSTSGDADDMPLDSEVIGTHTPEAPVEGNSSDEYY